MFVRLDQKGLEPPLIDMPCAHRLPMSVPALGVRQAQPSDERREVAVVARPQHQMPMVGHHAVGQHAHLHPSRGLVEDSLKRFVVLGRVEYLHSGVCPIQYVVY